MHQELAGSRASEPHPGRQGRLLGEHGSPSRQDLPRRLRDQGGLLDTGASTRRCPQPTGLQGEEQEGLGSGGGTTTHPRQEQGHSHRHRRAGGHDPGQVRPPEEGHQGWRTLLVERQCQRHEPHPGRATPSGFTWTWIEGLARALLELDSEELTSSTEQALADE